MKFGAPASWSSGNTFVSGVEGRGSNLGVVKSEPLRYFFKKSFVVYRRNDTQMGSANSLHASA